MLLDYSVEVKLCVVDFVLTLCNSSRLSRFHKIDHSGMDARIVLERSKIQQKVTSSRDRTLDSRTVVLTSCAQSHALPTELSGQVLIEGSSTQLLFVYQLTFELRGTERI